MAKQFRTGIIISGDASGAVKAVSLTDDQLKRLNETQGKTTTRAKELMGGMGSLTKQFLSLGGALGGALGAQQVVRYADTWSDLSSRVRLSIGEHESVTDTMDRLSSIARMTYFSLESTAESFARNSVTLQALGKSTQEQLDYTEALNNAMVVSGAKGDEFERVQDALSKAMAEGALRGDHLNTVLNSGSRIAQLLAEELGTNVTELSALAAQGKLTGDVIYRSLTQNMATLREEADSMPATIGDALILLRNGLLQTVGVFDQQNTISERLAESLIVVADNMDVLVSVAVAGGAVMAARFFGPIIAGMTAKTAATVLATAQTYRYQMALASLAGVSKTTATAQLALAGAVRGVSAALTLVGGPVGAAILAAGALIYFANSGERAKKKTEALKVELEQLANSFHKVSLEEQRAIADQQEGLVSSLRAQIAEHDRELRRIEDRWAKAKNTRYFNEGDREAAAAVLANEELAKRATAARGAIASLNRQIEEAQHALGGMRSAIADNEAGYMSAEAALAQLDGTMREFSGSSNEVTEEFARIKKGLEDQKRQLTLTDRELFEFNVTAALAAETDAKRAEELKKLALALYDENKALEASKKAVDDRKKAMESAGKELEKYFATEAKTSRESAQARAKTLEDMRYQTEVLRRQAAVVGQGEAAQAELNRQLAIENALRDESVRNLLPERQKEYLELIALQHDYAQQIANLQGQAGPFADVWEETSRRMGDSATQMWRDFIDGGRNAMDMVKDIFKDFLANMAHLAITRPIMVSLGMAAPAANAGGLGGGVSGSGGLGGIFNLASMANTAKNLWSGVSGLATGQGLSGFSGMFSGFGSAMNSAGMVINNAMNQMGGAFSTLSWGIESAGYSIAEMFGMQQVGAGQATMIGGLATAGAGAAGGYVGADLGRALTGKEGSGWGQAAGATIGAYVGSIIPVLGTYLGAAIGGLLGGVVDSIFGSSAWNTTRGGIELGFLDDEFSARAYERQTKKGGIFGSTKRRYRYSALDDETDAALAEMYAGTVDSVRSMFAAIGVDVADGMLEGVEIAAAQIGVSGKSKQSQEEIEAAIGKWFGDLSEALVSSVDANLDMEALTKMAGSLLSVNEVFRAMRLPLFEISRGGADAAAAMLEMAGGLEAFTEATDFYYQNFYSEQERAQHLVTEYSGILDLFNRQFGTAIRAKDDLRYFVEAIADSGLMATEQGQAMYLAAMDLAPVIGGLSDALEALGSEGRAAANQLAGLFASTYEQIMLDGMRADGERYNYFKAQADALAATFDSLSDPSQILAAGEQYNQLLQRAYSSLTEESQDLMREELLKTIEAVDSKLQERLQAPPVQTGPEPGEGVAQKIEDAVAKMVAENQRHEAEMRRQAEREAEQQRQANQELANSVNRFGGYVINLPNSFHFTVSSPEAGSY